MSMISDLVDRLRTEAESMGKYGVDYMATLLTRSADTIAIMSEKARSTEAKHGEWISKGKRIYRCSNCGNYLDFDGVNAGRGDANFCPNCGADMREREGE